MATLGELLAVELVARLLPYFEHELPLHNFTTSNLRGAPTPPGLPIQS